MPHNLENHVTIIQFLKLLPTSFSDKQVNGFRSWFLQKLRFVVKVIMVEKQPAKWGYLKSRLQSSLSTLQPTRVRAFKNCVCPWCVDVHTTVHVEVRGQLCGVKLPPLTLTWVATQVPDLLQTSFIYSAISLATEDFQYCKIRVYFENTTFFHDRACKKTSKQKSRRKSNKLGKHGLFENRKWKT